MVLFDALNHSLPYTDVFDALFSGHGFLYCGNTTNFASLIYLSNLAWMSRVMLILQPMISYSLIYPFPDSGV